MVPRTPPHPLRMPNSFADNISPTCSENLASAAESSPSVHKGPHRDGFTIDKCRTVLIKHCSWIPRNYTYRDGVSKVYAILREYLGDENMDLATAQLNELIEVPSEWATDAGAAFQSWRHDYMLRDRDLENAHVPSLGNVIVAPVLPTKRLKKWREDNPGHNRGILSSSQCLQHLPSLTGRQNTPGFGIGAGVRRSEWRLENAFFVSSRAEGTQVLNVPTAQELHARTWDSDFGRGGKLVHERNISPGDMITLPSRLASDPQQTGARNSLLSLRPVPSVARLGPVRRIRAMNLELSGAVKRTWLRKVRSRFMDRQMRQVETSGEQQSGLEEHPPDPLVGRFAEAVKAYENGDVTEGLPDPNNDEGKAYYRNVPTQPLPPGSVVPNARFARKHGLADQNVALPDETEMGSMPTADELAIEKNFQDPSEHFSKDGAPRLIGPFTPELFRDGGIDFLWGEAGRTAAVTERDIDLLSDVASLGDANQSPTKGLPSVSQCLETSPGRFHSPSPSFGGAQNRHDPSGALCNNVFHNPVHTDLASQSHTAQVRGAFKQKKSQPSIFWQDETDQLTTKVARTGVSTSSRTGVSISPQKLPSPKSKQDCSHAFQNCRNIDFSVLTQLKSPLSRIVAFIEMRTVHKETMATSDGNGNPVLTPALPMRGEQRKPTNGSNMNMMLGESQQQGSFTVSRNGPSLSSMGISETNIALPDPTVTAVGSTIMGVSPSKTRDTTPGGSSGGNFRELSPKEALRHAYHSLVTGLGGQDPSTSRAIDNGRADDLNSRVEGDLQISLELGLGNSLMSVSENSATRARTSSFPLDYEEVDLNRDLPPLPPPIPIRPLNVRKHAKHVMVEVEQDPKDEILRPDCYAPARDGLKHGGVQYHKDRIRHYPEPGQHPPRTSSMRKSNPPDNKSAGNRTEGLEMAKRSNAKTPVRSIALGTTISSCPPDASSGIMGNFMPLKGSNLGHTATTEATEDSCPAASYNSPLRMTDRLVREEAESDLEIMNDAASIDTNDPDALKYIEYLKKTDPEQYAKQPARTSDLSEYTDEDVESMSNGMDDETFVETEDDSKNPQFDFKDYQELIKRSPYEFEPENRESGPHRLTTITDFMYGLNISERTNPEPLRKLGHLKNSNSESNALYNAKRPEPIEIASADKSGQPLHRSGSSPNISPAGFAARRDGNPRFPRSPARGRGLSRPSANNLEIVPERDEDGFQTAPIAPKRSNSPIKRIFGEGGWLGSSPDSKEPGSQRPGLVRRVKLKIEEIALKADLMPMKNAPKAETEKSLVAISLKSAQQAELYLDIELIICDTANTFLMHEYQNCRMSVDSLKKVSDFWKSKGRPQVLEFHYDQLTQRDLIVANQKTFRFQSPSSGDELKVSAMLYTWRSNAREMAVRTFCYPDAMIRKHIRDTFMILDFLGGHPVQYLGLHEVNAKVVAWTKEAQRQSGQKGAVGLANDKTQRFSDESSPELVLDNPWYNHIRPTTGSSTENKHGGLNL